MSQGYKLRFDQMKENDPASVSRPQEVDDSLYEQSGHVRNLCLVWKTGRRMFLNYAYLLSALYEPGAEKNSIVLHFSGQTVRLSGYLLQELFMSIFEQYQRMIFETDERYAASDTPLVTEILVEEIKEG